MKHLYIFILALWVNHSFAQWTRVRQLPGSVIYSIYKKDSTLFVGGTDIVYISNDNGKNWDSTSKIPNLKPIDAVVLYKNELFAGSFGYGLYKSNNMGRTWTDVENNILPYISQFFEWHDNLYASTLGDGTFLLDSVTHNRWINFNRGTSDLSANIYCLNGNSRVMIAGTLANGIFDRRGYDTTAWTEEYIIGRIFPTEGFYEMATAHDSLFFAGFRAFYLSTDDGRSWKEVGTPLNSSTSTITNAKEAMIVARNTVTDDNNTIYYYIRKDSLDKPLVPFSEVDHLFTYRTEIAGNKLWAATTKGLFYMGLDQLPGISSPDEADSTESPHETTDSSKSPITVGNIYPNPVGNSAHLSVLFPKPAELTAAIYDQNGKKIHVVYAHQKFNKGRFDLSFMMLNYSSGPYFLTLTIDSKVFTRKIIHVN